VLPAAPVPATVHTVLFSKCMYLMRSFCVSATTTPLPSGMTAMPQGYLKRASLAYPSR